MRHLFAMREPPPDLEMTLDGHFVTPPRPPLLTRIMIWAIVIAVIAGGLSIAAFALWLAFIILPVALGAAAIAWLVFRYQVWRARSRFSGGSGLPWAPDMRQSGRAGTSRDDSWRN
jgi:hypothetical protein